MNDKIHRILLARNSIEFSEEKVKERSEQPVYVFSSSLHASGLMQEALVELYKRAKKSKLDWAIMKFNQNKIPFKKQFASRLDPESSLDQMSSPYIQKIGECLQVIEELEADKKGTTEEQQISTMDKFKLAVKYMQML